MTNSPPSGEERTDETWLAEIAARALGRCTGRLVGIERLARLDGGADRNVVARAHVRSGSGAAETVVIKASRAGSHDAGSPSVLRDSGLAREHVALTLLDARRSGTHELSRLLAGDADAGLVVLRDLGDLARTLVASLLEGDAEAGEGAVLGLAQALGELHAATARCETEHDATVAELYPASDGARPSSLEGLRWASRRMAEALGHAVDEGVLHALAERLEVPGPWTALVHGDPCPDNALRMRDGTIALLDFEFARPGHALFDATWWHMGFPSCWCAGTLPRRLVRRADARYREALIDAMPQAGDDRAYERELVHLCAVQLLWSAPRVLGGALGEDDAWGTACCRDRLWHWLATVAAMLERTGVLPALAPTVDAWLDALRHRGHDAGTLPPYPPWRRAPGFRE